MPDEAAASQRRGDGGRKRRAVALAVLVAVQSIAAVFFVADVAADLRWAGWTAHTALEAVVTVALVIGIVFGATETRRAVERAGRAEAALSAASGAFHDLMRSYFERWALTPAESEVATLAIKGFDVAEIAELRGAAASTVRVQLTRVYAKAGVANRGQLVGLFIEDLMGEALVPAAVDRR